MADVTGYATTENPLAGMFFFAAINGRDVVGVRIDELDCIPVFRGPEEIGRAERTFAYPPHQVFEITDAAKFLEVFHGGATTIIIDPYVKTDGVWQFDTITVHLVRTDVPLEELS